MYLKDKPKLRASFSFHSIISWNYTFFFFNIIFIFINIIIIIIIVIISLSASLSFFLGIIENVKVILFRDSIWLYKHVLKIMNICTRLCLSPRLSAFDSLKGLALELSFAKKHFFVKQKSLLFCKKPKSALYSYLLVHLFG